MDHTAIYTQEAGMHVVHSAEPELEVEGQAFKSVEEIVAFMESVDEDHRYQAQGEVLEIMA
jgi:hypothetical protein